MPAAPQRPGVLYVVATPIGNLEDVTLRALRVLGEVDLVAAEDTRRTRQLLRHHGIDARVTSYYDAVERRKAPELVARLAAGESIALVSDAGTPGIADPGYHLVRGAIAAGVRVEPVPGPSAVAALVSVAGLAVDRFVFEGFLPPAPPRVRRGCAPWPTKSGRWCFWKRAAGWERSWGTPRRHWASARRRSVAS